MICVSCFFIPQTDPDIISKPYFLHGMESFFFRASISPCMMKSFPTRQMWAHSSLARCMYITSRLLLKPLVLEVRMHVDVFLARVRCSSGALATRPDIARVSSKRSVQMLRKLWVRAQMCQVRCGDNMKLRFEPQLSEELRGGKLKQKLNRKERVYW